MTMHQGACELGVEFTATVAMLDQARAVWGEQARRLQN
jgi:hypothetical protein